MIPLAAFGIAALLVLTSAALLVVNLEGLRTSFRWVEHTERVLLNVSAIETSLIEAESAQRAYLLTGDTSYLQPHERARAHIERELAAMHNLVADNPDQLHLVEALRPLIDTRLDQMDSVMALGHDRMAEAVAVMRRAEVRTLTPAIRGRLDVFRQAELRLLADRQSEAARDAARTSILALVTGILALASTALGLFLFQRERARHRMQELQTELFHVARLNTMGQTAAALAHELNQPLTATGNYLKAARRMLDPAAAQAAETLGKAAAQIDRAAQIVRRLRNFVAKQEPERRAEEVASVIDEALTLLGPRRADAAVTRWIEPNLPRAFIDKVEVQQVLVNLMRNAIEAMAPSARRELLLAAVPADDGMIRISVKDTGPGLPAAVAERLFRPFVSTKKDGMGVGLSICRTIISAQGGRIWAEPTAEGGTAFHFTVPAAPSA